MRSKAFALVRAARPLAHANIAPPILFGQALAYATTGRFSWGAFVVAQLFGVIDHLVIVFANDYADRDADRLNTAPTPFSGGSRVLPDGELAPATVRAAAIVTATALVMFAWIVDTSLVPLALAAIALMGAYSYRPLRLSYRGGGELLQGLGVGVVLPMVGLVAQGASFDAHVLTLLAPTFVLGVAGNVLTSIPDEQADRDAGKRSPAARWGGTRARRVVIGLHFLGVLLGCAVLPLSWPRAAAVGTVALAPALLAISQRADDRRSILAFLVLGGATESLALLGWSLALTLG